MSTFVSKTFVEPGSTGKTVSGKFKSFRVLFIEYQENGNNPLPNSIQISLGGGTFDTFTRNAGLSVKGGFTQLNFKNDTAARLFIAVVISTEDFIDSAWLQKNAQTVVRAGPAIANIAGGGAMVVSVGYILPGANSVVTAAVKDPNLYIRKSVMISNHTAATKGSIVGADSTTRGAALFGETTTPPIETDGYLQVLNPGGGSPAFDCSFTEIYYVI